jgi:RNA polymerase sigma-70 factor (ECF subfamily)
MTALPNPSDEALMNQVAKGNLDAAALLFQRYHRALFNFYLQQGYARETSEDLVQTVFERLIKYRQSYREGMNLRTWLYQMARNAGSDQRKSQMRYGADDLSTQENKLVWSELGIDVQLENREKHQALDWALKALNAEQREVLFLTKFQQLKYSEVAVILNCSEGAVKVKVFRALEQLKAHYLKIENR